jgi:hypothetical protein
VRRTFRRSFSAGPFLDRRARPRDVLPSRSETWNRPDHELVKQRDREGHVSVCRAVDHPFLDQLGAHGPQAGDLDLECVGDIASPLSARSQLGHGAEKVLFTGRQAIVTNAKEILVKAWNDRGRGLLDGLLRDRTGRGQVPGLVAPFLNEVGIAFREAKDLVQRVWLERDPGRPRRILERFGRFGCRQCSDIGKIEKPLGLGFRFAGEPGQNRQASTQVHEGKLPLLDLVHRHDQGAELFLIEILHFVDEDRDGALFILGRFADRAEQIGQVDFEVTTVGSPLLGFDVQVDIPGYTGLYKLRVISCHNLRAGSGAVPAGEFIPWLAVATAPGRVRGPGQAVV